MYLPWLDYRSDVNAWQLQSAHRITHSTCEHEHADALHGLIIEFTKAFCAVEVGEEIFNHYIKNTFSQGI